MSLQRVRQLLAALRANLQETDKAYVVTALEPELQKLFFAMTVGDQAHALNVAHTAEALAEKQADKYVDRKILRRCALLHDVGRGCEAGTPFAKTLAVLLHKLGYGHLKRQPLDISRMGYINRIMYHHYYHPELGARLLAGLGYRQEAEIIARHHQQQGQHDPIELLLLRAADEMN